MGARVVCLDLSQAVEPAARNRVRRNALILQADVFSLPFAPESFDYIYSLGVSHHTPDCEQAVKKLPGLLKPRWELAIWLYSAYSRWYRCSHIYRTVTRHLPPRLLHTLCWGAIPLYGVHKVLRKIPLIGRPASGVLCYLIPISFDQNPEWRILDTFDWYSPWYQSKHTYEEAFRWLESCGIEDLHVAEVPISLLARKPAMRVEWRISKTATEVRSCAG
jgi:SAM-dependent methyltransferase